MPERLLKIRFRLFPFLSCISLLFVLPSQYKYNFDGTDSFTIVVVGEFRQPARGFEDD